MTTQANETIVQNRTALTWMNLGRLDYAKALETQESHRDKLLADADAGMMVYAVEHPPTITIGRSGTMEHIIAPRPWLESQGFAVYEVDRGGDVTYHGPGQLVVYPILRLGPWQNDIGRYVRMLEETVIRALLEVGITGERLEGYPGVWVGDDKICAIGVRVRRRPDGEFVTSHGLALNVSTNLAHFRTIVPCGIADKGVTSVAALLGEKADWSAWEQRLRRTFADVFAVNFDR
ncbi:MAG: lipoyl(octanoyl) transferase LipB [Alicyclobacillus sp.]|nr:lipoyl(octanoyl) transferase LipB [Alicyclobacillus sp.]